jgi:uncharacterized membrane protein
MEALFVLLILALLAGPVIAIIALVKVSTLSSKLSQLKSDVERLVAPNPVWASEKVAPSEAPPEVAKPAVAKRSKKALALEQAKAAETVEVVEPIIAEEVVAEAVLTPAAPRDVEKALASRWLVWLGGVAIALGGLLLIKYAHDNGLVPPVVRVIIGLAAGAALVVAGEWLRQKRGEEVVDYVPAALSAAGLVIGFGVSYAAYALYNIVAPAVCFPLLAAISLGALWLSQRQGPLIAALGLVGATFTPALVPSDNPSTSGFFAYLLVIVVASLWLLRRVRWWWLGFAALAVGAAWALLWINNTGTTPSLPIGLFGLAIGAAAVWVPRGRGILDESMGSLWDSKTLSPPMGVAIAGCVAGSIILAALAVRSGHATLPLIMFALGMLAVVGFGWFRSGLVTAPLLAAVAALLVLVSWHNVGFHAWAFDESGFWSTVPGLIEPPRFRNAVLVAMVGFVLVGILGILRKVETRPWALLSAGVAFVFLFAAWARADFTLTWSSWAMLAGLLIAALSFGVWKLLPRLNTPTVAQSVEVLVAGVAALAVFALDRCFDGVTLTIAIAVLAAALAFLTQRVALSNIVGIASVVASFAAIRLFVGREFWGEPQGLFLGAHWVLYGYGIPALLFWQASRWLNRKGFERWRVAFEGLSLGLAISLVSLELRVLIGGGVTQDNMGLLELAAHGCAWLGAAYGLAYRQQLYSSFVSIWGARVLLAASTCVFLGLLTLRLPFVTGDAIVGSQIFNSLWLAYLVPVLLYALMARKLEGLGWGQWRSGFGVFALVLLMAFVTLFVMRQFQGATLSNYFESEAESYTVSLVWLLTGIGIFIAGLKLERQTIRYGGLAVLVLTVLKVFGYDLFLLGGLWRIASIIGLGLCLVGVGWLYTRYVGERNVNNV